MSDTSKATVLCAHGKLILTFGTSGEGAYKGESRGIITMIGELISKISLKGKVKRDFIERRAMKIGRAHV